MEQGAWSREQGARSVEHGAGGMERGAWRQVVDCQIVNPNVADLCRGKTRQNAPDVVAHSLGQIEAYFTVREILAEASTAADGVFWREHRGFGRYRFAMLELTSC